MQFLNLGILAHVDAGKTSLTERLLHDAGVTDALGSVDAGDTQTDTLALERRRGITIKSAVVAFTIDDLVVNLIDTPGHPDFIAEVERVLRVLDGAVLVVSAVEGVQAQTRVLMRTLKRLEIPTLIFVNKTDRRGADPERVAREVADKLRIAAAPAGSTQLAELLADHDDAFLAAYLDGATVRTSWRRRPGARSCTRCSAARRSPEPGGRADARHPRPAAHRHHRRRSRERHRVQGRTRRRVRPHGRGHAARPRAVAAQKVTAIEVFEPGGLSKRDALAAGQIGKVSGLACASATRSEAPRTSATSSRPRRSRRSSTPATASPCTAR